MSVTIWPFTLAQGGFREFRSFETEASRMAGGREVRASRISSAGLLLVRGPLRLPDAGGQTFDGLASFLEALKGGFDTFLYRPWWDRHRVITQESIGPGTGSQQDFPVSRRYVDTSTIVVRVGGVVKSLGADYSIQDLAGGAYALGDTGLQIHFTAAPGNGVAVDASYSHYFPMVLEDDDLLDQAELRATSGSSAASATFWVQEVRLRQDFPGSERRVVPAV